MRKYFFLFIFFISFVGVAQEMPPISNFDTKTYSAGNQNWMLSQGPDRHIFIANNLGLLEYNGEQWSLNEVPDGSAVRSVLALEDRVYTGSYMDFGYWEKKRTGCLEYHSLEKYLKEAEILDGEQFWHIEEFGDYIVFQSLRRLYNYNRETGRVKVIEAEGTISNLYKVNENLYYQVAEVGLFTIRRGEAELFVSNELINNSPIVSLFYEENGRILAVTRDDGLYYAEPGNWEKKELDEYPLSESIFSAERLNDGTLILGTIGGGLYIIDGKAGRLKLSQPVILNNTVLSVMEDKEGNIWCGLDNGLSLINMDSPFRLFTDTYGEIGTVYCSYVKDGLKYLGTNQGLYYNRLGANEEFKMVPGTSGQVWSINEIEGVLYVGHDLGTFRINGNKAEQLFDGLGTWEVKKLGNGILQGHYNGISYNMENELPRYFDDFDLSSRNLVIENDSVVWVGHDHKGIFRLKLDEDYKRVIAKKNYPVSYEERLGLKVFKFRDEIYYSTENKVYKYFSAGDKFTSDNELNSLTEDKPRISGISRVLDDNTWWTFGKDNLYYVKADVFQDKLISKTVPLPLEYRSIARGFENISLIAEQRYLVGSNVGYAVFDLPLPEGETRKLSINLVETAQNGTSYTPADLETEKLSLPNETNYLNFGFSVPHYGKLNDLKYSYFIENYSSSWSDWSSEGSANIKNLPAGNYVFKVKAKYNNKVTNTASYAFVIARPWYLSNLAIMVYVLLLIVLIYLVHFFYTRYYKRQRDKLIEKNRKKLEIKQLESQQEIITLKNQKLEADVESKNRELAASTMNLIKKNEFLTDLKNKLASAEKKEDIREVIKIIDKDIAEKDNWKLFKEAFDNADKDFLQSVQNAHPNLTSNDLKLCAYLRLNLSSKEIAPLLNISVRSVEIKRYRLRKKMELDHDQGLVEYILTF
ncbi:helix-turn-helix and ligand-binding sensor domain-containing protein [Salegentibacter chungangensis]|uniref:Triple tyrosine motif-containing protein n=1 Tax=Salegentibacter chungangensis TaxID=1335724 RepID=A0ABW3NMR0_9FLAO